MTDPDAPLPEHAPRRPAMFDTALQLGLMALLVYACIRIVLPFAGILLWSVILAVMLNPLHARLAARLGNRWSAVLIGVVGVLVVLVPMGMVATSLASSLFSVVSGLKDHTLVIPPPPARLAEIPLVGQKLTDAWALVATNMSAAMTQYGGMLRGFAAGLAAFAGKLAGGALSFVLSFVIAAILIAYSKGSVGFAKRLLALITGSWEQGTRLVGLTAATIRGVAVGVVGVAVIQALLLGVGFFVIGIPAAGLWTLAALLLGIVQVPATVLTLPLIAYVLATEPLTPALIFAVWTFVAGLSDNFLKPLMLGRGLEAPMPIILIGVIGGMVADGLLGLFVGPVLLAIAYVLFMDWVRQHPVAGAPPIEDPAP